MVNTHAFIWIFDHIIPIVVFFIAIYQRDKIFRQWWWEQQCGIKKDLKCTYTKCIISLIWIAIAVLSVIWFVTNLGGSGEV